MPSMPWLHCIWLGGEGGVEAQGYDHVQRWSHFFRYNNIENRFATNILVNGLYTKLLNPLLSALHSSMTFRLCSRTHAGVMHAKHIYFL
jgi:hypothetical protein